MGGGSEQRISAHRVASPDTMTLVASVHFWGNWTHFTKFFYRFLDVTT